MWHLGYRFVSIFPDNGFTWENNGGTVILEGTGFIGNDAYLSFGPKTTVIFGDNFGNPAAMKLASHCQVTFGRNTLVGWAVLITDSNFHKLYDMENNVEKHTEAPVVIGDDNWFAAYCKIMPGTSTPDRCVFGMDTLITRGCVKESNCVMGGNPVKVLARNTRLMNE